MQAFVHASRHFYGSHRLKGHPSCDKECGHAWGVRVTVTGEETVDRWGMPVDDEQLVIDLESLCRELRGKDIDAMIAPSVSSLIGIAHWFDARLSHTYDVTEVAVWNEELLSATLRKP